MTTALGHPPMTSQEVLVDPSNDSLLDTAEDPLDASANLRLVDSPVTIPEVPAEPALKTPQFFYKAAAPAPPSPERLEGIINFHLPQVSALRPSFRQLADIIFQEWEAPIDFAQTPTNELELQARRTAVGHIFGAHYGVLTHAARAGKLPDMLVDLHMERNRYRYRIPPHDMTTRLFAVVRALRPIDTADPQTFMPYLSADQLGDLHALRASHPPIRL